MRLTNKESSKDFKLCCWVKMYARWAGRTGWTPSGSEGIMSTGISAKKKDRSEGKAGHSK